jgi:hypothetical protein
LKENAILYGSVGAAGLIGGLVNRLLSRPRSAIPLHGRPTPIHVPCGPANRAQTSPVVMHMLTRGMVLLLCAPGVAALLISKKMTFDTLIGLAIGLSNAFGKAAAHR